MGFTLSLLVFFVLVRFVLPRVLRAVLGGFVRQQVNKAQQGGAYPPGGPQAGGQQPGSSGTYQAPTSRPTAPGQVRVDYMPPKAQTERKGEFRGGEYVEYEEL